MVCFPDRTVNLSARGLFLITTGILAVLFLSSCGRVEVQVLTDPYLEQIHSGNWAPLTREFRFRALLRGFRVSSDLVDDRNTDPASAVLPGTDIVILSPYLAAAFSDGSDGSDGSDAERRYIVAGGTAPPGFQQAEALVSDRSKAMARIGKQAGESYYSEVFALFNVQTPAEGQELTSFLEAFNSAADNPGRLVLVNLAEEPDQEFSSGIEEQMLEADLAVLLAGPVNLTAIIAGDRSGIPVMTENVIGSGIRSDRVLASVEDDRRKLMKALLEQLDENDGSRIRTYPATVYRKKWFDAILPSNL